MRIDRVPTPRGFVANVFSPGRRWLDANPHVIPIKPLWREAYLTDGRTCRETLAERYHHICAYSLFRVRVSFDVDHYRPIADCRKLAYCWLNYRLADSRVNARKHTVELPDPFKVGINACSLNFEKEAIIEVDKTQPGWECLEKAVTTLRLNIGALKTGRYEAYTLYLSEDPQERIGVIPLSKNYPFVAYEMLKQGRLKKGDEDKCRDILHDLGFSWV